MSQLLRFLNYFSFTVVILLLLPFFLIVPLASILIGKKTAYKLPILWGWIWLSCFGIYRRCQIHPEIKKNESYLFMSEHFSLHDVPLWRTTWPGETYGLSAKEYSSVPIYGWILRLTGTHFIERRNTKQALADLASLSIKMKQDKSSVLMVPTGTRASDATLLPFKKGVFQAALSLKFPIVPVYLIGLENLISGKYFIRAGSVVVVYGAPIRPEDHPNAFFNRETLLQFVRTRMQEEGKTLREFISR